MFVINWFFTGPNGLISVYTVHKPIFHYTNDGVENRKNHHTFQLYLNSMPNLLTHGFRCVECDENESKVTEIAKQIYRVFGDRKKNNSAYS